jgi:hypothetical protein
VTYKTSICRRYLSLASWGNLGGIHANLTFDYLSISIEVKTANPGYPGNHGCKFIQLWETDVNRLVCVYYYISIYSVIPCGY